MDPGRDEGAECPSFLTDAARLGAAEPASVVALEAGTDSFSGFIAAAEEEHKRRTPGEMARGWRKREREVFVRAPAQR